jgi:hypothetical protein
MVEHMQDRRIEPRLLCADMVEIRWKDKTGKTRRAVANLEDISISGACLQLESAVPLNAKVQIGYAKGELTGTVRYCVYREIGYFLGVQFEEGNKWSQRSFKPMHLFDPRRLSPKMTPEEMRNLESNA